MENQQEIHIGKQIKDELRRQERTVTWLAHQLCYERTNVYSIFRRKSIDAELLLRISRILHYNFFTFYTNQLSPADRDYFSTQVWFIITLDYKRVELSVRKFVGDIKMDD